MPATLVFNPTDRFTRSERLNIAPSGKRFSCNFIEPGIINYADAGGGIELLRKETIDEALNTAIGNPLTVGHISTKLSDFAGREHGRTDRVHYNADSGWYICEGSVSTDEARERIKRGERPSCGYSVLEFGPGGIYHNIPYEAEIKRIKFHHLAIVDNPRYEGADIRLNSKPTPAMFKIFKNIFSKDAAGKDQTTVEETTLPGETMIEVDGKQVRLNELTAAKIAADAAAKKKADAEAAARANAIHGDDDVEIDGKKVKVNELVKCYQTYGKCNEKGANEEKSEEAKEKRDNELKVAAEKEKAEAAARENAAAAGRQSFKVLAGASSTPPLGNTARANSAGTQQECLARGKSRYGTATHGKN